MSVVIGLLELLLLIVEGVLAAIIGYLLLLTGAALWGPSRTLARQGTPTQRFIIVVPAHNEELLLPQLLANLRQLDYPAQLYAVHVVADNCSDRTAEVGRSSGAIVHERENQELLGKGHALEWLLQQIWSSGEPHDAVVFIDADSVVSSNFLRVMDARLARGERVIQAYYAVRDPEHAWSAGLRSVALIMVHYLRPLGRMTLGGSTGLKGNGMVFAADILRQHRWTASLTEDIEYHMDLILAGERAMFAPDAVVWAEMPSTLRASQTQNARWERGRMDMIRGYVPRLLGEAVRRRSFLLFDAAVEQLIPPFSIVAAANVACLLAALALQSWPGMLLGAAIGVGQMIYIFSGLALARASWRIYQALLFAPVFVAWKVLLYVRLLGGFAPKGWVRTVRNDG